MTHTKTLALKALLLALVCAAYARGLTVIHDSMTGPQAHETDGIIHVLMLVTMPMAICLTLMTMMPELSRIMNRHD